jgi:Uncharacterized protein conserved in bacteria (DUF2188)
MAARKAAKGREGEPVSGAQSNVLTTDDLSRLYVIAVFTHQNQYDSAMRLIDDTLSPVARQVAEYLSRKRTAPGSSLVAKVAADMRHAADVAVQRSLKGRPDVYIERRGDGRYAVLRPNAARASAVRETQRAAIEAAKDMFPGVKPGIINVYTAKNTTRDKAAKEVFTGAKPDIIHIRSAKNVTRDKWRKV